MDVVYFCHGCRKPFKSKAAAVRCPECGKDGPTLMMTVGEDEPTPVAEKPGWFKKKKK